MWKTEGSEGIMPLLDACYKKYLGESHLLGLSIQSNGKLFGQLLN